MTRLLIAQAISLRPTDPVFKKHLRDCRAAGVAPDMPDSNDGNDGNEATKKKASKKKGKKKEKAVSEWE